MSPADDAGGDFHERLVYGGKALESNAQASEFVQPREGALDDPPGLAEAAAVGLTTARDLRGDTGSVQGLTIFVVIVTAIGCTTTGFDRGRPRLPRMGGMASIRGSSWVTSLRLAPARISACGMPCASVTRWCFEPGRARSVGLGPIFDPIPLHEWRTNR